MSEKINKNPENDFDPMIDGLQDAPRLASWLLSHKAKLDVSKAQGLAATRLVVAALDGEGQWAIPLRSAIDMVDIDDGWFATATPADIHVTGMSDDSPSQVEVLYTGIDDELRRSTIDSYASASFEPIQHIPNN